MNKQILQRYLIGMLTNFVSWKTNRKIVVFLSDDWGTIRTDSLKARTILENAGINMNEFFDRYDSLERASDLEGLFDVLSSVKDKNGNPAVFTPLALPVNPDFKRLIANESSEYEYIKLPELLNTHPGHEGTWKLWQEGIERKLFMPQFHGREHMNVNILLEGIKNKDKNVLLNIENNSYSGLATKGYLSTYGFKSTDELPNLKQSIEEGIQLFKVVFNFNPMHFTAPQGNYSCELEETLFLNGIKSLDTHRIKNEHLGDNLYKKKFAYTGMKNSSNQLYYIIRNCMLEQYAKSGIDWVDFCMYGIDSAFRMKTPAIISTHRVNFVGKIDPQNRDRGLKALKQLLSQTIKKWPNVEFLSVEDLFDAIKK